jgi:hypothetical protein
VVDEETPDTNHNMYPIEHKRRRNRARYAAMSLLQREAINKKRRDTRVAKCLFKTPQDKEIRRQQQRDYKKKIKEHRHDNLHPDSIAMANPQWKPQLLFPPGDKPPSRVSEEMVIPDFGGSPVYVEVVVREPPQQDGTPKTFLSNTIHTAHLTPGLRETR